MNPLDDLRCLGYVVICDSLPGRVRLCLTHPSGIIVGADQVPTRRVYVYARDVRAAVALALTWLGVEVGYAVEQAQRHD